jgi:hypothetical protein
MFIVGLVKCLSVKLFSATRLELDSTTSYIILGIFRSMYIGWAIYKSKHISHISFNSSFIEYISQDSFFTRAIELKVNKSQKLRQKQAEVGVLNETGIENETQRERMNNSNDRE